VRIQAKKTL